ncbi:MAG TPA: hypothetical protein VF748_11685 [Candidatus Acidoferrum sp.]
MTDEDIVRAVRTIRYSPKAARFGRRAQSVRALALAAGINPLTIYRIASNGRISPIVANKLRLVMGSDSLGADLLQGGVN